MIRKSTAALLLAVLFAILPVLAGCTQNATEFTVLADNIPTNLDPQLSETAAEKTAVVNLFEGLYRRDTGGTPQLAAAKSVAVSDDGLVYTFALHPGRYWGSYTTNGERVTPEVTADDFVFAFQRIFDKQTASPWSGDFAAIENADLVLAGHSGAERLGITALDEYTLEIRLSSPDPSLPEKLCSAGAMPCNRAFFQVTYGAYGLSYSYLLTNGPFAIYYWISGDTLILERGEKERGWVKTLSFEAPAGGDGRTLGQRYADGEGNGALVALDEAAEGAISFDITTLALAFNCREDFLADAQVRAALAGAALGSGLPLEGQAALSRATGLVPPGVTLGDESYRALAGELLSPAANPAALLRAALRQQDENGNATGYYNDPPMLTVLVPEGAGYALLDEINERWQHTLACYFAVEALPLEDLLARVNGGSYQIALLPLYAETGDAGDMLSAFSGGGVTGWQSGVFEALLQAAARQTDPDDRLQSLAAAEQALLAEWPVVPLAFEAGAFDTRGSYAGLSVVPFGPVLDFSAPEA